MPGGEVPGNRLSGGRRLIDPVQTRFEHSIGLFAPNRYRALALR